MPYQIKLPDGSLAWIADNVPQSKALELAKQNYPDAFPQPPGIGSQLLSAPKEFIKGTASGLVQAAGGLGALPYAGVRYFMPELKPFEQTGFGQAITGAERYLAPSDEGVVTQLAGGLGSFASILGPQALLRGVGTVGRFAGMAPRAAAPVAVAQTAGLGVEEARQRVEIARGDKINVTPGEELAALSVGVPIGLTELLPVEKLFRGLDKTLSGAVKLDIANYIKRGLAQGGIEGAQEAASGLMQDLSAKGIYNPNLEIGQSIVGDAALGGGVGFIAQTGLDFLLRKDIGRAYQAKLNQDRQTELNTRLDQLQREKDQQLETTRRNLGVPDSNMLALPAPAPKVEKGEARDPLMNPVGFFNAEELTPAYLRAVNNIRKTEGKRGIQQFSIEDLADAGAPQAEIDRLLTYKTGYDGKTKLSAEDVMNLAAEKNVDTSTVGFMDFLRRATGSEDVTTMSQPQLFSAFKALDGLSPSDKTQILPPGTNATRFSDDQYNRSLKNLTALFPKNNMMSRDKAVQEIKEFSGLESDRDAESLLQTAIRNGDLTTTNRKVFEVGIPGDMTSPPVRRYTTREAAENAAARLGLEVRERTHQDVAIPGTAAQLPGGPDIRQGTFKQGVAPAGFEIRSPDAVLQTAPSQEEADAKADRLQKLRAQKANGYLGDIAKKEAEMAKSQRKLESMEADGKADTLEYKKIAAGVAAQNKRLQNEINALKAKVQNYTAPLEVAPKGEKPVTRDGFTLFEQGQPVATFPSQQAAEEAALLRLPDETLDRIVKLAPSQKGLMPKRLGKMAEAELRRRRGEQPAGFGVEFTGDKAAAEARLAEAGVFTPEFQKAADELAKKLRPMMERLGLGDLRLNILKAIKTANGQTADGYYLQKVIAIAMDADNPIRTLRHEGIHALKELGAFTPEQWRVLENKAKSEWMAKYDIANRYRGMGMSQADMIEEAIADAFSDFDKTKAPPGLIGALFNKIRQFLDAFGNGLRGMGFQTAEGIFTRAETGGLKPATVGRTTVRPGGEAVPEEPKYQLPRVMSTGKIVGAPPGMSTEEDRTRLVEQMTNLLSHPYSLYDESKNWYEDSGRAIMEITRGDPVLTERVVRLMALYSQANSVGGNTTATISSIAQMAAGDPTAFAGRFPNTTAARIPALLAAPTMDTSVPGVDDKLMNFYRNLHDATYGVDTFQDASTIDRWMMRLFGYPHAEDQEEGGASGVSNTQYTYAKDLIRRIGEANMARTGEALKPRQVQAILWTYVKNTTDYNSLPPEKQATFEPSIIDFSDYITRATANITWESRPSTKLPLIPGIHKASRAEQEAFNRAVRAIFIDPETGADKIFELLGNQQLYSSQFSIGAYENLIAPNVITKLVLQKDDGDYLTDVANKYAAIIGYVTKQDAVPWYRADPTAGGKDASKGYRVTATNAEANPGFEERLFKHLNEKIPGIGFTRVGNSFDFINFRDTDTGKPYMMSDKQYLGKLQSALESFDKAVNFDVEPFRAKSGWISNDWTENTNGQGYLERFSPAELTNLRRYIEGWSADYDRIADQFGQEYGWSDPRKFSLRPSTEGDGISLGTRQPGAVTVDAVHYGKEKVDTLLGSKYGTGIRGAEAKRLQYADPRIKNRVYFYIPKVDGTMPLPESGLGGHVYIQRFNNILGPGPEMARISRESFGDSNNFESGVVDAGYDGYAVPNMGMMVILNNDTPVEYRGTRDEVSRKPEEQTVQIGDRRYSLRATREFFNQADQIDEPEGVAIIRENWIGGVSGVGDRDSMYDLYRVDGGKKYIQDVQNFVRQELGEKFNGYRLMSNEELEELQTGAMGSQFASFTLNPDVARAFKNIPAYAKKTGLSIVEMELTPEHVNMIGHPGEMELVIDYGEGYNPSEIKVVEKYSLRKQTDTPEFKKWFGDSKVVDADGKPLVVYTGTSKDVDFTKFKVPKSGAWFTSDRNVASQYALENDSMDIKTKDYRTFTEVNKASRVMPVFLNISNPYSLTDEDLKSLRYASNYKKEQGKIFEQAKSQGYDGIDFGDGTWVVIKSPNQIKSATGNIGTFDAASPDIRYSLRQTNTPEFKKWFGKSTVVDDEGKPKVMYHGTARDITEFKPKQANAIFVTNRPRFAEGFADMSEDFMTKELADEIDNQPELKKQLITKAVDKAIKDKTLLTNKNSNGLHSTTREEHITSFLQRPFRRSIDAIAFGDFLNQELKNRLPSFGNIMPLYVRAENPFDYENENQVKQLVKFLRKNLDGSYFSTRDGFIPLKNLPKFISSGSWTTIETDDVQAAIKALGHDGFYVMEGGLKNLGVYDPNQIKSAIGNIGTFARDNNDIRYALALKGLQPDSALVPNEGGNPDGNLGVMPERLTGKPIRMLIGTHSDTVDTMRNAEMYRPVSYGANHILNRVLSDPKRIPGGAEELLEKIVRTAQNTAQNYNAIYKEGNRFIIYDGKNSLVVSPDKDEMSIITMYVQENPQRRYGNPVWTGRAPTVAQFVQPVRGREVIAQDGRVTDKPIAVKTKRVYTPEEIGSVETQPVQTPRKAGTLSLRKDAFKYSLRDSLGQDTVDAIERTTTAREEKGFAQRMGEALSPTGFTKIRQAFINKYEAIERLSKDVAQQFGSAELLADTSAIAATLFSDRAAGIAASSYQNGVPIYRNGFTTVSDKDGSVKGLIPILEPLMKYNDPFVFQAFQFYAATRRGKRLTAEGREQLFTAQDIQRGELIGQQYPEFKEVFDEYQKYNKGLVDFMRDTGVISEKEAEIWTQNWDYIPFYRQMEGEEIAGPNIFSAIAGVAKPRKLKGGEAPLADFMETIVRNSRAAIEAGMKNVAAQRVVRDVLRLNQGQFVPAALARGADIVTVKENGQTKHYQVDDPLLVESLKGLNLPQLPFLEVLAAPANLLRNLVTKDPGFILANLMRDSMQAWVTTGTNITPIVDTFKQYGAALANKSKEAQALAKAGLFAGYDFGDDAKSSARALEAELRKRTGTRTGKEVALLPISTIWNMLDKASSASDVATRAEVYKRTLAETGNEAEALYQAMEVLNFSRKGNSALIRVLTATIPFMNARIQGLDVLYRSGFGKAASRNKERMQKAFITRSLTLMGLSWMYWMLVSDSEEYKNLTDEERDNYWIVPFIKSNDKPLRIPIPFEIGTLFKVFPERILEYSMGEDTSKDLKDAVIRNLTSTLAVNPVPQAILPMLENLANYSVFTGQPIVGRGLEDVAPKYQASAGTSLLAQQIGEATNYSPVKIDNLIRGYTGTLGTYAVMALDAIMRGEGDPTKASLRFEQMPVAKRFFTQGTGTIDKYYEMKKAVDESVRTINFLERTGNLEDLREYLVDKGAKLQGVKPYIQALDKDMTMLREMRRTVQMSSMEPDQKRDALDNIRNAEVKLTSRIQFLKKSID